MHTIHTQPLHLGCELCHQVYANREDCNNKLDMRRYKGAEKDSCGATVFKRLLMKTCIGRATVDKGVAFEICAENNAENDDDDSTDLFSLDGSS